MVGLQLSCSGKCGERILLGSHLLSSTSRACLRRIELNQGYLHYQSPKAAKVKLFVSMCSNGRSSSVQGYETNTALRYTEDHVDKLADEGQEALKFYSTQEQSDGKVESRTPGPGEGAAEPKKYAKIHDFCLGIPYGGLLFGGGLFGFLFSRNPASLTTSLLGAAVLAMAACSLKVWRSGLSSLPFMIGQAALAGALVVKHFGFLSVTKKVFPSGLYIFLSVGMLCFYSYVLLSGGNPPPKKKLAAA